MGQTDWDLILRVFLDLGYADNEDELFFEDSETLVGAGLGLEFTVKQNLSLRADWGVALKTVDTVDRPIKSGSDEFHFVFVVSY